MDELKTPHEWCVKYDIPLHDADGWVMSFRDFGGAKPWSEPISLNEFYHRATYCTTDFSRPGWRQISEDLRKGAMPSI